ncbi:MAG: metal-sensitive transcriptional regulator [Chloroflexi bacterium]|nr:metal-sensitive transcriptional regulator [Chloroflexota bacterium]
MSIGGERGAAVRHAQRATGQTLALASMIATKRPFAAVAQQILAARGSLDSLLMRLVELELRDCVSNSQARDEIDELLRTAFGHGARGRPPARSGRHRSRAVPSTLTVEGTSAP